MREAVAAGHTGILCWSRSALVSFHAAISDDLVVNMTAEGDTLTKRLATAGLEIKSRRTFHDATKPLPADLNLLSADNAEHLQTADEEPIAHIEVSAV